MEAQSVPAAPGVLARLSSQLSWYWTLPPPGRSAFWATFSGWALDAYNQMTLGFVLPAVTAAFALSTTQAGLLSAAYSIGAFFTSIPAGYLSSRFGPRRTAIWGLWGLGVASMLFGLHANDPLSLLAAVFVMLLIAALAGYLPARRASRVDPMVALRYE